LIDTKEIRRLISSEGTDYNDLCIDLVCDIVPALCDEIDELRGVEQLVAHQTLNLGTKVIEGSSPSTSVINNPVRVLCMCEGGYNRSGALALQLKQRGIDAIQIGWRHNTAETINHFVAWADFVIRRRPKLIQYTQKRSACLTSDQTYGALIPIWS
jgi:hypothetical protein